MLQGTTIAIVIPCYKVSQHPLQVVDSVPDWVDKIHLVDDACPDNSVASL
jgi:dolichol-phosphate mannosyltransferase